MTFIKQAAKVMAIITGMLTASTVGALAGFAMSGKLPDLLTQLATLL